MANQNKLAHWLFSNKSVFNPRFTELDWPTTYFPGLYDFSTTINFAEIIAEGRGVDTDRSLALEKSVAEAIERLIFYKRKISFLGFAVSGQNGAENHAYCEALERYFLYVQLKEKISFKPLEINSSDVNSSTQLDEFSKRIPQAKVSFYLMAAPTPFFGVVCLIEMHKLTNIFGFSLSKDLQNSITKSFRESLANFAWHHSTHITEHKVNQTVQKNPPHLQQEFISKITPLLARNNNKETIAIPDFERIEINIADFPEFKTCPISPVGFLIKGQEIKLW